MKFSNYDIPVAEKNNPTVVPNPSNTRKTSTKFACRDPYIVPYNGKYYFYQGAGSRGIICSVSEDLENWSEAVTVFEVPENFHGVKDLFWAPECHYYKGNFYIFTSVYSKTIEHRCISVYKADNPLGPFVDIADGCIAPKDWDTIDGTLYVDNEGQPWMVFVHEWTSMPDHNGGMCAAKLSEDFTHLISEPVELFRAKDPDWAKNNGVTDGPFLYTTESGNLLMIWSNGSAKGYVVALAESKSGLITGPWTHCKDLVYQNGLFDKAVTDGGHGMIFKTFDGEIKMAIHGPNYSKREEGVFEHLKFFDVVETEDGLIKLQ